MHSPAVLGVPPEEAGWRQDQADRDTRPLARGMTPQGCLQQHQDSYAFRKVSLTQAPSGSLLSFRLVHRSAIDTGLRAKSFRRH